MASNNLNIATRQLGQDGPQVPRLGLGCVSLGGGAYGLAASDEERFAFLDQAYELGARFWDTGSYPFPPKASPPLWLGLGANMINSGRVRRC